MTPETIHQIAALIRQEQNRAFNPSTWEPVFGGDINHCFLMRDEDQAWFIKINDAEHLPMLWAERESLQVLHATQTLKVPEPLVAGRTDSYAFLVMEYLPLHSRGNARRLAQGLIRLHRQTSPDGKFGWRQNNFIGTSPQYNQWHSNWADFWWQERLLPQLEMAYRKGHAASLRTLADQLKARLPDLLADHTPQASLLHGDLWNGNAAYLASGEPVIFDPASYYGDRETDLAMTELFSGFASDFYQEYEKLWPLPEGYPQRKKLYNLYHLLNHLNLFGDGYLNQCRNLLTQIL